MVSSSLASETGANVVLFGRETLFNQPTDGFCTRRNVGLFTPPIVDLLNPTGRSDHLEASRFLLFHIDYVASVDNGYNP